MASKSRSRLGLLTVLTVLLGAGNRSVSAYTAWTATSMERIRPEARPPASPSLSARISLAGGEYESFQIVLSTGSGEDLAGVQVSVTDLVHSVSGERIPASDVKWFQVGFVKLETMTSPLVPPPDPSIWEPSCPPTTGWWPDPLLPVPSFRVGPSFSQAVWVTVRARPGTQPGSYAGKVILSPTGKPPSTIDLQVAVYGFTLPPGAGRVKTAFSLSRDWMDWILGNVSPEVWRKYGSFMLEHRLNPTYLYGKVAPSVADLEYFLERGMTSYQIAFPDFQTRDEMRGVLAAFLSDLGKSPRAKELRDMAYVYGFDEIGWEKFQAMKDMFGMIESEFKIPTFTTGYIFDNPPATARDYHVSWYCPITGSASGADAQAYDLKKAELARQAGFQVWSYVSVLPHKPLANLDIGRSPLVESRVLWWQAFQQRMDGMLYWGTTIWGRPGNRKPINPADGPLLAWNVTTDIPDWAAIHGDGLLIYPGVDGPMSSIRLENVRDGLEDEEYLFELAKVSGSLDSAFRACLPVTSGIGTFTRNPAKVYAQREIIARQVERRTVSTRPQADGRRKLRPLSRSRPMLILDVGGEGEPRDIAGRRPQASGGIPPEGEGLRGKAGSAR